MTSQAAAGGPSVLASERAREVEAQTGALLGGWGLPRHFTLPVLVEYANRHRTRRLALQSFPLPPNGPCGLLVAGADVDIIVFQEHTTPFHQAHIVLHEFGHLVFGHGYHHNDVTPLQELDAELFATLVHARAVLTTEWPDAPASADYDFYHLLNMRRPWL